MTHKRSATALLSPGLPAGVVREVFPPEATMGGDQPFPHAYDYELDIGEGKEQGRLTVQIVCGKDD
jgi:hypothetical protein